MAASTHQLTFFYLLKNQLKFNPGRNHRSDPHDFRPTNMVKIHGHGRKLVATIGTFTNRLDIIDHCLRNSFYLSSSFLLF